MIQGGGKFRFFLHPLSHALTNPLSLSLTPRNPPARLGPVPIRGFAILAAGTLDAIVRSVDFTKRNGMGGESIYGSPFPDEDLSHELDSHGCVTNSHLPVSGACPAGCGKVVQSL